MHAAEICMLHYQDGGFIAEIVGGLRTDAGAVQLQLLLGAAIVSVWPPAQSATFGVRAAAPSPSAAPNLKGAQRS